MTESPPSPRSIAPWIRLAVTLGLLILVTWIPPVGLPGVDMSGLPEIAQRSGSLSVFALGIMPFVSAAYLVEIVAALVPRWRPLRHGGPAGRAKLGRAMWILGAALCVFQGFGIARLIQSLSVEAAIGSISVPMVVLTMTAGTFLLGLAAQLAGGYGLAGGFAVLVTGLPVVALVRKVVTGETAHAPTARTLGTFAAHVAVVAAATWFVLRRAKGAALAAPGAPGYRVAASRDEAPAVAIPAPASGVVPLTIAASLAAFPATLALLAPPLQGIARALEDERTYRVVSLLLLVVVGAACAWGFNAPTRVAGLVSRAGEGRDAGSLEAEARGGLREAGLRSIAFLVVLFAADQIARPSHLGEGSTMIALCTALVLDLAAEWRARRAVPDLVPVWPDHRPYALAAAREALGAAGIAVYARGENLRQLLQLGGPHVPIDLLVRRADAEKATEILEKVLRFHAEDEPAEKKPAPAPRRPWARAEVNLAGALVLLAGGVLALPTEAPPPPVSYAPARPEALKLLPVDDRAEPFEGAQDDLPPGVSIRLENAPDGPGHTRVVHYAAVVKGDGETLEQARARFIAWAQKARVPEQERVLVSPLSEYDEEKERFEQIGWRTYVVKEPAPVDGSHVRSAMAQAEAHERGMPGGWLVRVELNADGAERFRVLTAAHVKRRIAIVVDGDVASAPVVQSEIPGGVVTITMGTGDPEQQRRDATRLERALRGQ